MHSVADGKLQSITKETVEAGTASVDFVLSVKPDDDIHQIKFFFWDSMNNMLPLAEPLWDYFCANREYVESGEYCYVVSGDEISVVGYFGEGDGRPCSREVDFWR